MIFNFKVSSKGSFGVTDTSTAENENMVYILLKFQPLKHTHIQQHRKTINSTFPAQIVVFIFLCVLWCLFSRGNDNYNCRPLSFLNGIIERLMNFICRYFCSSDFCHVAAASCCLVTCSARNNNVGNN